MSAIIFSTRTFGTYDKMSMDGVIYIFFSRLRDVIKIKVVIKSKEDTHEGVFLFPKIMSAKKKSM
ncbi:hypothetical protein ABE43_28425 [Bacillus thuringiensis]|nr:hypothetical protein [Bacillus thuringiensis]